MKKQINKINKIKKLIELFDIYKNLLTPSQIETFQMYYFDDYSLIEIANDKKVSKNAIYSSLKSTEKLINNYEEKIGFLKYKKENNIIK